MPLSLHEISIPVFLRGFESLSHVLEKGRAFADGNGIPQAELTAARLFPDMLPLTGQIQRASDTAKFVPVRVAGVENVPMADDEVTFADMQARIDATVAFLRAVPAGMMNAGEDREIVIRTRRAELAYRGTDYVLHYALPNFHFHLTTAYGILRHKGVPLSKSDFLGGGRQQERRAGS